MSFLNITQQSYFILVDSKSTKQSKNMKTSESKEKNGNSKNHSEKHKIIKNTFKSNFSLTYRFINH